MARVNEVRYFNGTTTVQLTPFTGLSANDHDNFNISGCPKLQEKTFSADFDTILAVTERGEYNLGKNPVNAYLTFWPSNINFTALLPNDEISDMPKIWALFSSEYVGVKTLMTQLTIYSPMYYFNDIVYVKDNFNFTLAKTNAAPYNLTSTLNDYYGEGSIPMNMTRCNSDDTITWDTNLISQTWWHNVGYNYSYPDPVVDLQFDGRSANLTVTGYFDATPAPVGKNTFNTLDVEARGQIRISFSGKIDGYHSDELISGSATPTWLRTVGFQNSTSTSSGTRAKRLSGAWTLVAGSLIAMFVLLI